jgi:LysM repeat protein
MRTAAAFLLLCSMAGTAVAKVVTYTARPGDTAESIAADYYGNRSLALFIAEGNGLAHDAKLRPGQKVHIPTAFRYRVRRGDTLEALAQKFLDDKRRAQFLAAFSGMRMSDKLREGQELLVPFQHVHRAEAPESLQSVARAFYGDAGQAKTLADYNFRTSPMLAKGERLLVPIAHVRIRSVHLDPAAREPGKPSPRAVAAAKEAPEREAELAARVGAQLDAAEREYKDGSYADVPAKLDKLLTEEDPSEAQLAEIFRLKAFAFVALGMDELAVNAFREVLARKPEASLDEATVSPKIRAAFERAKKAPAP